GGGHTAAPLSRGDADGLWRCQGQPPRCWRSLRGPAPMRRSLQARRPRDGGEDAAEEENDLVEMHRLRAVLQQVDTSKAGQAAVGGAGAPVEPPEPAPPGEAPGDAVAPDSSASPGAVDASDAPAGALVEAEVPESLAVLGEPASRPVAQADPAVEEVPESLAVLGEPASRPVAQADPAVEEAEPEPPSPGDVRQRG
ncbi:unnamed protein product, partial [Prorocentrum cordatum]